LLKAAWTQHGKALMTSQEIQLFYNRNPFPKCFKREILEELEPGSQDVKKGLGSHDLKAKKRLTKQPGEDYHFSLT